jgi:hypothetical protein
MYLIENSYEKLKQKKTNGEGIWILQLNSRI